MTERSSELDHDYNLSSHLPFKQHPEPEVILESTDEIWVQKDEEEICLNASRKRVAPSSPNGRDTAQVSKRRAFKERGATESRDNRGYDRGNTKDSLFRSGNPRQVPAGLRRAAGGDGGEDGEDGGDMDGEEESGSNDDTRSDSESDGEKMEQTPSAKARGKQTAETGPDEVEYLRSMTDIQMRFGRHREACELQEQLIELSTLDDVLIASTAEMVAVWCDKGQHSFALRLQKKLLGRVKDGGTLMLITQQMTTQWGQRGMTKEVVEVERLSCKKALKLSEGINLRVMMMTTRARAWLQVGTATTERKRCERQLIALLVSGDSGKITSQYLVAALKHLVQDGSHGILANLINSTKDSNRDISLSLRFAKVLESEDAARPFKKCLKWQLMMAMITLRDGDARTIATEERAEAWCYLRHSGYSVGMLMAGFRKMASSSITRLSILRRMAVAWRARGMLEEAKYTVEWLEIDFIRTVRQQYGNRKGFPHSAPTGLIAAYGCLKQYSCSGRLEALSDTPRSNSYWLKSAFDEKSVIPREVLSPGSIIRWLDESLFDHMLASPSPDIHLEVEEPQGSNSKTGGLPQADVTDWLIDLSEVEESSQTNDTVFPSHGYAAPWSLLDSSVSWYEEDEYEESEYEDVGYEDVGYEDVGYEDVGYEDVGYEDVGYEEDEYEEDAAPSPSASNYSTTL